MEKTSNLKDFQVIAKLGEGAFGQVFKVKRKQDKKQYALKKVKIGGMKQKQRNNALNEIRILASYDNDYIIGYKDAFYDEPSACLCVVMEFASGGDILKINQKHTKNKTKYKQEEIWKGLVQMTQGLKSLHDKKILHRDMKCANIFVTEDGIYKLGDLNVSKVLKKDMAQTQTGTPYYASPEVWKDKPYGLKSDMWSLGCVLYEMAALRPPFVATDLQGLYKKICAGYFERIPMAYSSDLANVISSLLKIDPIARPGTEQILGSQTVRKNYKGKIDYKEDEQQDFDQLLKTIKYNGKDLKGLKNHLPKANYEEKPEIQSCKNQKKQPNIKHEIEKSLQINQDKLTQFMEKKRKVQEIQRQKYLKSISQQRQQLVKKRQRVLSACGIRKNSYCQSPRRDVQEKKEAPKKEQIKSSSKMPPKPQGNLNYKLPPKPTINQEYLSNKKTNEAPKKFSGSKTPSHRVTRSNSVQKVIYPSWWG